MSDYKKRLNYSGWKQLLLVVTRMRICVGVVKLVLKITWSVDRIFSHLKLPALVDDCGDCLAHWTIRIIKGENISIGNGVGIGQHVTLGAAARIDIEDAVRISDYAIIQTGGLDMSGEPPYLGHVAKPIRIKRGAWIGARAIVLAGVTIGENAVIGAGAIVSRDVPDNSVIVSARVRTL